MQDEESSVLTAFQQGSIDAFETLFRLHQHTVFSWALRIVRSLPPPKILLSKPSGAFIALTPVTSHRAVLRRGREPSPPTRPSIGSAHRSPIGNRNRICSKDCPLRTSRIRPSPLIFARKPRRPFAAFRPSSALPPFLRSLKNCRTSRLPSRSASRSLPSKSVSFARSVCFEKIYNSRGSHHECTR